MSEVALGLLHPGEMGSSVGASARAAGARVVWASQGRGPDTHERAVAAELEDLGSLESLLGAAGVVISVCPPHAAADVARAVAKCGFAGLYVDANAVAPATSRSIGAVVEAAGAEFVDAGIIGPPAWRPGTTRMYLSGPAAARVARLFEGGALAAIRIDGPVGAASALKLAFASWTKGSSALLMAIRALAIHEGVDAALLEEWKTSLPDLPARSEGVVRGTARKAWRFVGEMEEIAASFRAAGLPDGFHRAAAEVYSKLAGYKDAREPPSVEEVARALASAPDAE
jgi:3-hydroxyisobutyrate dehydrogenase-like beta-hydroxyacid dehydrogenase